MSILVYLIRHGETLWNTEKRLQGQLDSPLTPEGLEQASVLARRLSSLHFHTVYSSDLNRAWQTATLIASQLNHCTVMVDERIRERNFGSFQGLTWEEISAQFPEEAARELSGNPMNQVPGGESKQQLLARAVSFFEDVTRRHASQRILVVSHGGILNVWTRHVLHIPFTSPRRFRLDNTAINVFEFCNGYWSVQTIGENP